MAEESVEVTKEEKMEAEGAENIVGGGEEKAATAELQYTMEGCLMRSLISLYVYNYIIHYHSVTIY